MRYHELQTTDTYKRGDIIKGNQLRLILNNKTLVFWTRFNEFEFESYGDFQVNECVRTDSNHILGKWREQPK